jgi:hypothetical protein
MDKKEQGYRMFASFVKTAKVSVESHYRPKKDLTLLMTKPYELDEDDNDDNADKRPIKQKLSGMVIPWMSTKRGEVSIYY